MVNYKAGLGTWILLDKHYAIGTEAIYTYTPPANIILNQYKEIKILFKGQTTATLQLELLISSMTSGYYETFSIVDDGVTAETQNANASECKLMTTVLIDAAKNVTLEIHIFMLPQGKVHIMWVGIAGGEGQIIGTCEVTDSTIDDIIIQTSTSTWTANTDIEVLALR